MEREEKEKFRKELNVMEKSDITAILEHLATVGAHWQQRARNHAASLSRSDDDAKKVHAGDEVTYITPELRKKRRTTTRAAAIDGAWDILHGDSIHPVSFADAKLSRRKRRRRTTDEDIAVNGTNCSIDTTSCSVIKEAGSRALLNRCWQRAMHAASNPIMMVDDQEDAKMLPELSAPNPVEETSPECFSPNRAIAKCKAIGLRLLLIPNDDDGSKIRKCPSCEITAFETNEQVHRHYYGMSNQRGCCWRLIDEREHDLIHRALQGEVNMVIQQVGRSIRAHSSRRMTAENPLDWKGVLSSLQNAVTARNRTRQTTSLAGIVADSRVLLPSAVDASLMEVIQDRLLDRYADVLR